MFEIIPFFLVLFFSFNIPDVDEKKKEISDKNKSTMNLLRGRKTNAKTTETPKNDDDDDSNRIVKCFLFFFVVFAFDV